MNNRLPNRNGIESYRWSPISRIITSWVLLVGLFAALFPISVQAAPVLRPGEADSDITFRITAEQVSSYSGKICVGEEVKFLVKVHKNSLDASRKPVKELLPYITVTTTVSPSSVLQLKSPSSMKTAPDFEYINAVEFRFKGSKAGSATLYFEAMLPAGYLSSTALDGKTTSQLREMRYLQTETYLQVVECPIEFKVLDRYNVVMPGYQLDMVGVVNYTVLQALDTEGKEFYADATKYLVLRQFGAECKFGLAVAQKAVEIRAQKRDDGGYHVEYTQGPAVFDYLAVCEGGSGMISVDFPDPDGTDFIVGPEGGYHLRRIPTPGGIVMWSYNRVRPRNK